jgi:hypothetical protein
LRANGWPERFAPQHLVAEERTLVRGRPEPGRWVLLLRFKALLWLRAADGGAEA